MGADQQAQPPHSDYYTLVGAARAAGARVVRVRGGYSAAQRAIDAELQAA